MIHCDDNEREQLHCTTFTWWSSSAAFFCTAAVQMKLHYIKLSTVIVKDGYKQTLSNIIFTKHAWKCVARFSFRALGFHCAAEKFSLLPHSSGISNQGSNWTRIDQDWRPLRPCIFSHGAHVLISRQHSGYWLISIWCTYIQFPCINIHSPPTFQQFVTL